MKAKEFVMALNGKKLPIALVITIMGGGIGYGELKNKVATQGEDLKSLKPMTEQVARIEERVGDLKEDFIDFRGEQRKVNTATDNKLDRILEEVMK